MQQVWHRVFLLCLHSKEAALTVYFACVHSKISYAILAWGHAADTVRVFALQRRAIRILSNIGYRDNCRFYFTKLKILTVYSLYIYHQCLVHVKNHENSYNTHESIHYHHTRTKGNIYTDFCRIHKLKTGKSY